MKPIMSIAVILIKNNKILLGKRLSKHGHGAWGPPGGKLDFKESFEECAIRETFEETGIKISNIKQSHITNNIFENEEIHSISLFYVATTNEEPKIMEPEKCSEWKWFDWDNLPKPTFLPIKLLKETGFNPFE